MIRDPLTPDWSSVPVAKFPSRVIRCTEAWRYDDYAHRPHVKNLIPRHTIYSYSRMQEVWLDR